MGSPLRNGVGRVLAYNIAIYKTGKKRLFPRAGPSMVNEVAIVLNSVRAHRADMGARRAFAANHDCADTSVGSLR